jgi:alkanesulfonate monooxygenase SsuD/methylene tetrahydromethanopterin reductase-like flavin-dependent oxidoreductase (luciferase family)
MNFGTFFYNQARSGVPEQRLFEEVIEQVALSEQLGFDEAWFAEHHHSDYSILPSPNLLIAACSQRTRRMRLGNLINILPFHDPIRLAEEIGMLDLMTGGRLDVGIGRGIRRAEFAAMGLDKAGAEARFDEALDIMLKAWATEERFSYDGKFWRYSNIAVRPKPLQRPHPPFVYGAITQVSVDRAARRGWHLAQARQPLDDLVPMAARYREQRAMHGLDADEGRVILVREVFVAETDEEAWAIAGPALLRFWQLADDNKLGTTPLKPEDLPRLTKGWAFLRGGATLQQLDDWGVVLVGSPQRVAKRIREIGSTIAPTSLVGVFAFGSLDHGQVARSLELFAREVMPRCQPGWA